MAPRLSVPIKKKFSSDEAGENVAYGVSSMQGWRITQEDAHNCCINFDENASLFAIYDGHLGHEVAQYCSLKLPDFIKQTDAYKRGDFKQALIDGYLGFDATLVKPEIRKILIEIAQTKIQSGDENESCDSDKEKQITNSLEDVKEQPSSTDKIEAEKEKLNCSSNSSDQACTSTSGTNDDKGEIKNDIKPTETNDEEQVLLSTTTSNSEVSHSQDKNDKKQEAGKSELPDSSEDVKDQVSSKNKIKIEAEINGKEKLNCDADSSKVDGVSSSCTLLENSKAGQQESISSPSVTPVDSSNDDLKGPGVGSGCAAVVALLHGQDLYVANAGDSRCILCRDGESLELTSDHKPKKEIEKKRILNAGGWITKKGRINGNLNLSRVIGDHFYKRNTQLPPEEQMITALPDVRHVTIDPKRDEFLILACDGIWDVMSCSDAVQFVKSRINEAGDRISKICEELFDHCLAPDTKGDSTDNMTAVIVKFKNFSPIITNNGQADELPALKEVESSKSLDMDESVPNNESNEENELKKI